MAAPTAKRSTNELLVSPVGTFSFPHVFTPNVDSESGRKTYEVTIGFTPEEQATPAFKEFAAKLQAMLFTTAGLKLGTTDVETIRNAFASGELRNPLRRDKPEKKGFVPGTVYFTARKNAEVGKPGVADANLQPILDASEIYGGVKGRISFTTFWYERKGNAGVSFGLSNVQKAADGERLGGGGSKPTDDFDKLAGTSAPSLDGLM